MVQFIQGLIGNDYLATVIMSFVPLVELKGGIVFARGAYLSFLLAFALAYVGSTAVFFPIYFLLRPILNFLKKIKWFERFAVKVENYFQDKATKTLEEQKDKTKKTRLSGKLLKQLGVFIFVAIPLPMTGVWTGTAIAVFLGLKFKDAVLPVVIGNFIAGLIISLLSELCLALWTIEVLDYILYALFALALILLVVFIVKVVTKKTSNKEKGN
jgi:uncharacterized membrane protein